MSKSESQNSSDEHNHQTVSVEDSKDYYNSSIIDINISQLQFQRDNTNNLDHPQIFRDLSLEYLPQKYSFQPQTIVPKLSKSLLKLGGTRKKSKIDFICFGDKRVVIERREIEDLIDIKKGKKYEKVVYCEEVIEFVISRLFRTQYEFIPLDVRTDTFLLSAIEEGTSVEINRQPIDHFECHQEVSLTRRPRSKQIGRLAQLPIRKDEVIVEVLSPDQQDVIDFASKSQTLANLKARIASSFPQLSGQMMLLTYSKLKLFGNRTRLGEMPELVLEVYQGKKTFIDPTFLKHQTICPSSKTNAYSIQRTEPSSLPFTEAIEVSSSRIHGSMSLQIREHWLEEIESGGLMGYIKGERKRRRSLMTLLAAKVSGSQLVLQFYGKEGSQMVEYSFSSDKLLTDVMTCILVVTRDFSHASKFFHDVLSLLILIKQYSSKSFHKISMGGVIVALPDFLLQGRQLCCRL